MGNLRTTVILKTDIVDSTPRTAGQTQSEMSLQRKQHKQFISNIAAKNHGSIFQEEGDAYWMQFPSVTTAVLAAMEVHQDLLSLQAGQVEKQRLAIRAVITVGDILYQETDAIGTTLSLTARIEKVTPPDEIYLSHAAWLVLNKAEVQTSFVSEFNFKGFVEPEKVYRVKNTYRTRVLTDQYIVYMDIRGWKAYIGSKTIHEVETFLLDYDDLLNEICDSYGGVIRNKFGDEYFLTFTDPQMLFSAMERLCTSWRRIIERYQLGLSVGIHHGQLNILRSYLYGNDIHTTFYLERLGHWAGPGAAGVSVFVSRKVKENVEGTNWERNFRALDGSRITDVSLHSVLNEHGVFEFIP
jgi:class 3 adenylate cyclase